MRESVTPVLERRGRVLLLDDSELTVEATQALLERAEFEVKALINADDFMHELAIFAPDVAVLDVNMPDINGASLCRLVKATTPVTVILFSNLANVELARVAANCEADAYVSKQTDFRNLPERVRDLCVAAVEPDALRHRVLLLDDSDLALHFERSLLELEGFEVRCANNLQDFVAELSKWRPDIILTDVEMPGMDGDDICRRLKARVETSRIPVVLFSTLPNEVLEQLSARANADAYLSKQGGYDRLGSKLRSLCEEILW